VLAEMDVDLLVMRLWIVGIEWWKEEYIWRTLHCDREMDFWILIGREE
jgi:hypothetical protein